MNGDEGGEIEMNGVDRERDGDEGGEIEMNGGEYLCLGEIKKEE